MLPYDKIPAERKAIGNLADPLDDELGLLNVNLAVWIARDDSKADASVTRAGNQVLDSIDAMLSQLHQLRGSHGRRVPRGPGHRRRPGRRAPRRTRSSAATGGRRVMYADHDHRGDYADQRHDHDGDYAERHHRHYDDESAARGLREDLGAAEERIRELEDGIRRLWTHISSMPGGV